MTQPNADARNIAALDAQRTLGQIIRIQVDGNGAAANGTGGATSLCERLA
jgi:hypothetical protein